MNEFANIGLSLITPSLTNPRKDFNLVKMAELTESIKASGVHQPVLVRFLPGNRTPDTGREVIYELVAGERRYRACQAAGLDTIPAMIRPLTDDQVLEIQIIENLQRDDLTELEEAEGYEKLMEHSGITAEDVAVKIGKSRTYVFNRRKLLDLCVDGKKAMREGRIDFSRAQLIARIPDSKLQIKALKFALDPQGYPAEPPSVRRLQAWLKDNVMLKLEHAVFKITDSRLIEAAGSCSDCPKRTGANPDLFADVDSSDICTDPVCFHSKEEAHRAQLIKKAEVKGMRIVQDKEALEMLDGRQWMEVPTDYIDLSEKRPDLTNEGERPISLAQALGKDAPAPILFIHPRTQKVTELVPEEETEAILLLKGLIKNQQKRADKRESLDDQLAYLQDTVKREIERAGRTAVNAAAVEAIRQTTAAEAKKLLTSEVLRANLQQEMGYMGEDQFARVIGYEFADGEDESEVLSGHINRLGDADLIRTTALIFLDRGEDNYSATTSAIQEAFVQSLAIDTKSVTKKAAATIRADYNQRIKELQAQIDAQKKASSTASLAQPANAEKQSDTKPQKPAARKAKLSAKDAMSGIAAAMQSEERAQTTAPEVPQNEQGPADPLLAKAVEVIVREGKVSVRLLKTSLSIGQTKAIELIDKLQDAGKVSAVDANGARKVLVSV